MNVSLRNSLSLISDPCHLDESVREVFLLMMGIECRRVGEDSVLDDDPVTAVIGFGGLLSGACVFRTSSETAADLAERLTGMSFSGVDDTVKDGIGEICNMLAGAWKGRIPELAAHCGLSVPAIITGRDYKLRVQAPEFQLAHTYRFDSGAFMVTIVCDGLH